MPLCGLSSANWYIFSLLARYLFDVPFAGSLSLFTGFSALFIFGQILALGV